jgi:hypothetical protein
MANTAVFGIYQNRVQLEDAVSALHKVGFRNTDTAVLFSENQGSKDFAHERHTKAPKCAVSGAGLCALVGSVPPKLLFRPSGPNDFGAGEFFLCHHS